MLLEGGEGPARFKRLRHVALHWCRWTEHRECHNPSPSARPIVSSPHCRPANGRVHELPTPSSGCTRSSSDASKRRPCCRPPKRLRCCSGRCWQPGRSPCGKSTAGRRFQKNHLHRLLSSLTSSHDQITSRLPGGCAEQFQPHSRTPPCWQELR